MFEKKRLFNFAIDLKKAFPELEKYNLDYMESCLRRLQVDVYSNKINSPSVLLRLTLPLVLCLMLVLFISLPINFLITGKWYYRCHWFEKWLRSLKLL